jgi:hypothetical protein
MGRGCGLHPISNALYHKQKTKTMTQELKAQIITWVQKNEDSYREECDGGDITSYMAEDAISKFGTWDDGEENEDLRYWIGRIVWKTLEGKDTSED